VDTEGPFHKYKAARQAQGYISLHGMDGNSLAVCLTLYLTENSIESKLQLEIQSTERLENCVLANMVELTREGKWQAV
jgi:predicted metal-binding protein